jgi:hypothetical protein
MNAGTFRRLSRNLKLSNLSPNLACQLLNDEFGIRRTPATMAKLRCLGGSPEYQKAGRAVLYSENALREWAHSMLSAPRRNTSDKGSAAA